MNLTYATLLKRHLAGENSVLRSASRRSAYMYCHGNRSEQMLIAITHDLLWDFGKVVTEEGVGVTVEDFSLLVVGNVLTVKQDDRLVLRARYGSATRSIEVESSDLNPLELQSFRKMVARWLEHHKLQTRLQPSLTRQGPPNAYIVAQQAALQTRPHPHRSAIATKPGLQPQQPVCGKHRPGKPGRSRWLSLGLSIGMFAVTALGCVLHPATQEMLVTTLSQLSASVPLGSSEVQPTRSMVQKR